MDTQSGSGLRGQTMGLFGSVTDWIAHKAQRHAYEQKIRDAERLLDPRVYKVDAVRFGDAAGHIVDASYDDLTTSRDIRGFAKRAEQSGGAGYSRAVLYAALERSNDLPHTREMAQSGLFNQVRQCKEERDFAGATGLLKDVLKASGGRIEDNVHHFEVRRQILDIGAHVATFGYPEESRLSEDGAATPDRPRAMRLDVGRVISKRHGHLCDLMAIAAGMPHAQYELSNLGRELIHVVQTQDSSASIRDESGIRVRLVDYMIDRQKAALPPDIRDDHFPRAPALDGQYHSESRPV